MGYERFVGMRYLMAKKRSSVVSIITLISISGVALGVTALIVVLSVMGGFKKDLTQKILGTKAHVVIHMADDSPIKDYDALTRKVTAFAHVVGASPYVEGEVMISSATGLNGVMLRGIDPERIGQVSELPRNITKGRLEYLESPGDLIQALARSRRESREKLLGRLRAETKEFEAAKGAPDKEPPTGDDPLPTLQAAAPLEEAGDIPELPAEEEGMPFLFDELEEVAPEIPGIVIGKELGKSLDVQLGDEVNVVTPNGDIGPMGRMPKSQPFRVVAIFYSGMYEYDAKSAYTTLDIARDFTQSQGASGIEVKATSVELAMEVAQTLTEQLGAPFKVLDWKQMNSSLFFALKLEKIAMFVLLTFIILVASFSIIAMLIMIVIEKAREIAVLKSLGASPQGIMRTFVFQGTVIGTLGAGIGLGFGLGICFVLKRYKFPLDSDVYYIPTLPVEIDPTEVVMVVLCAIVISMITTIYPSIQAARLHPVDGLRHD